MAELKSRHAFGSEANVDYAIENNLIDAYDILFLDEGKIGWVDKNGNKVILEDKEQVALVNSLPELGNSNVIYICDSKLYLWTGSEFISPAENGGVSEDAVDSKIAFAKTEILEEAKAYADKQVAASHGDIVIEF